MTAPTHDPEREARVLARLQQMADDAQRRANSIQDLDPSADNMQVVAATYRRLLGGATARLDDFDAEVRELLGGDA